MKGKVIVFAMLLVCLMPLMAYAQDLRNVILLKSGAYFPTGELEDADFDPGFNGEVAYGRYLHPNFATEFGVGYFQSDSEGGGVNADIWVIPLTVTVRGVIPMPGGELYAGAGAGAYVAEIDMRVLGVSGEDDDAVIGGHVVAGATLDINPFMFVGVEGKYLFTEEAEFTVFGVPFETDLDGFTVTAMVGFRF